LRLQTLDLFAGIVSEDFFKESQKYHLIKV